MKTTIDAAGRLVIPKEIRHQAGLGPGMAVDIRLENGLIQIEPVSTPIQLVREGHLLVARPVSDVPPLTSEAVQSTIDSIRRERGGAE
jgi:AbrB family looped-hinge helix DNA binding protein